MFQPVPSKKTERRIHDCHNPFELDFETKLRSLYPKPERVFFSIKRQVWTIGKSSLMNFIEKFEPQKFRLTGCVVTRGGSVFYQGTILTTCDTPTVDNYLYHLRLMVSEHPVCYVPATELY